MQIKIKDLSQKEFKIDIEPTSTVHDLKAKIQAEQSVLIEEQKLIYSGKVLKDEDTLEQANVQETGFMVLMKSRVSKPKPVAKPEPVAAPVEAAPVETAPAVQTESAQASAAPSVPSTSFNDPSSLVTGDQLQAVINNFLEMGFEKAQIDQAMKAAFNNPERATEYLLTGIPDQLVQELTTPEPRAVANPPSQTSEAPISGNLFDAAEQYTQSQNQSSGGDADLSSLRSNPHFSVIRQAIQENPALIQPILSSLAQSNPALAQQISQNPEFFMQLLGESEDESAVATMGSEEDSQGTHYIQVTAEENEAIGRLEALGFDRNIVLQAYFACDKNEELAANYLFEHGYDD